MRDRLAGSSGLVARELKLIDQQDALDQLSPLPEADLDDLFEVDGDWRTIRDTMMYWIEDTLLFRKEDEPRTPGTHSVDDPFRFHYYPPDGNNQSPTLIPSSGFINDFWALLILKHQAVVQPYRNPIRMLYTVLLPSGAE